MTQKKANLFLLACILFAAGTGLFAYASLDWSTVGVTIAETSASRVPDIESADISATLTALPRATGTATRSAATTRTPATSTPTAPPLASDGVTVNGVIYRVNKVVAPEPPGLFKPPAGRHIVGVSVSITAGAVPLSYAFTQFRLIDGAGQEYGWALGNSEPKLEQGVLAAGATRTGWIAFSLPDGAKPAVITVQPAPGGPKTPIATIP